ncbi:hypothetical protein [Microbulbifer epialgicus]|uniref:Transposase n=1 Tax=Microbulbifer epialgicus TaxID=393907 RepID=A0ABV4NUT5_9GAMM
MANSVFSYRAVRHFGLLFAVTQCKGLLRREGIAAMAIGQNWKLLNAQ